MNYKLIYDNIIKKYKELNLIKSRLTETHHIIPKCVGGTNNKDNLIVVPTRVHYILHLLLWKIKDFTKEQHNKLTSALFCMSKLSINKERRRKFKFNSVLYEKYSNERRKIQSEKCKQWGSVTPGIHFTKGHLGHKHSEEARKKMSKKRKPSNKFGRKKKWFWAYNPITKQNINVFEGQIIPDGFIKGRIISEESKLKNSLKHLGKKASKESNIKRSVSLKKTFSSNIKYKQNQSRRCKLMWNDLEPLICPNCGKISKSHSAMYQFHFKNCKYKHIINNLYIISIIKTKTWGQRINGLILKYDNNIFIANNCLYKGDKLYNKFTEEFLLGKFVSIAFVEETQNQDGSRSLRFPVLKYVYEKKRDL